MTRFDQKFKILGVLESHELVSTKHTKYQLTYFIYYLFQDKFENPRIIKKYIKSYQENMIEFWIIYFYLKYIWI